MKLFTPLFFAFLMLALDSQGQTVPQGMKYQAVARDLKGQVMANQFIQLKISLYSDPVKRDVAYIEIHKVYTSELGLFSLSIGEGIRFKGRFENIPWSSAEIWMEVAVQTDDETDFITISDSRMLSVPYAFHAATANEVIGSAGDRSPGDSYTKIWNLTGNAQTNPARDKLGTNDLADLVIVTNDVERMRVLQTGDISMVNSLKVGRDLNVSKHVYLNTDTINDPYNANYIPGQTINYGNFTVGKMSSTYLSGTLTVDKHTELNSTLNVDGQTKITDATQSTTTGNGALVVGGGAGIGGNLNVAGDLSVGGSASLGGPLHVTDSTQSTSDSTGALIVDGGVGIRKNLNIGGQLGVASEDTAFVATIENQNTTTGDGLRIKLGKTHPAYNAGSYLNIPDPSAEIFENGVETIKGWVQGEPFEIEDAFVFISPSWIAGTACMLTEKLGGVLNDAMGLPTGVPPLTDAIIFDAFNSFADPLLDDDWRPDPPTTLIPGFTLQFPTDFCPDFLPSFSLPNISFGNVNNSLTHENKFISFVDNENRQLGSIRAQASLDWAEDYFDYSFFIGFLANVLSLDPLDIFLSALKEFSFMADSYNSIGVEYTSGHGDYAEWLERTHPEEVITRGDIVAVKGGKITKNLADAEQVMAVSAYPIVLGNLPSASEAHLGNNVAFMGQIPVKIMGPVNTGDYILADTKIPGYGIAKAQKDLATEDMPLVVGRAWETKAGEGPKMVNTVVGVHNGDYFRILKQYEQKLNDAEARLDAFSRESAGRMESIENRLDMLMEQLGKPESKDKVTYNR
jgi:hypothetical protein